jgi:hypothetical protein
VPALEHALTAMTRARDARSPIRLVLALSLASVFAALLLCANAAGGTTPSVNSSELGGHAGKVSFAVGDVAHSATDRTVHPGSVPEARRAGRRVPSRHSAAGRKARRRVRATRDDDPLPLAWLLPFAMLVSVGGAVSVAVSQWTRVSDLRLPATRGPPRRELAHFQAFASTRPGGRAQPARGQKLLKRSRCDLGALWDAP